MTPAQACKSCAPHLLEAACADPEETQKISRCNLNHLPENFGGLRARKPAGLQRAYNRAHETPGLPIWLLRDVPAFLGVMISFWPLVILVITNGFAAMRGRMVRKTVFDQIPILLAHAEARLDFALWREAYRRLGWNHRASCRSTCSPRPTTWAEIEQRFEAYRRANMTSKPAPAPTSKTCASATASASAKPQMPAAAPSVSLRDATSPGFAGGGNAPRPLPPSPKGGGGAHALARDGGG